MPESTDERLPDAVSAGVDSEPIAERVRAAEPGLTAMLAEAERTWRARAEDTFAGTPGWRPFEDAFPTFYQFTNRPR